jgi:LacI family transcriptional regulator
MHRKTGIAGIAKETGLSRSTISRALNFSPLVNEETRKLIEETALRLNFKPNKAARSLVSQKAITIGVVVFSEPAYFWDEVRYGVLKAENDLRDFGVVIKYYSTDIRRPQEQLEVIRALENEPLDGLIISPNDPSLIVDEIDRLTEKNIKVVTVSNDMPESRRFCHIECNNYHAGRTAGSLMERFIRGGKKVAIITHTHTVNAIRDRVIGFREVMEKSAGLSILGPYRLSRTGEDVEDFIANLLNTTPDLGGIFVSYGVLEQVGRAVNAAGKGNSVVLVGYDLSTEIAELIRSETVDAVITQEPFYQGYYSAKIMADYLLENKKPSVSVIQTRLAIVTRENLSCYEHEAEYCSFLFGI